MKVAEILRAIADIIDAAQATESEMALPTPAELQCDTTVDQIAALAGVTRANTTPEEVVFPLDSAFPAGDDVHAKKNPSDIRADSVSMYPGYGATK